MRWAGMPSMRVYVRMRYFVNAYFVAHATARKHTTNSTPTATQTTIPLHPSYGLE